MRPLYDMSPDYAHHHPHSYPTRPQKPQKKTPNLYQTKIGFKSIPNPPTTSIFRSHLSMSSTPRQVFNKCMEVLTKDSFKDSFRRMFMMKQIRPGTLVGKDQFGNHYYEAPPGNMELRERWVEFGGKKSDLNACRLPPEWHLWVSRISLEPPTKIKLEQPKYTIQWNPPELSNMAQTPNYVPCHYFVKPKDVAPVQYPRQKYTSWNPNAAAV